MTIPVECEPAVEPCCNGLWSTANDLANVVANAIIDCSPPATCDDLTPWVSHDEPIGPGHYVAVWLMTSRFTTSRVGRQRPQARWGIRYVEPGFPKLDVKGGKPVTPSRDSLHFASMHSYAHLEAALNAIQENLRTINACAAITFEEVAPLRLAAGYGGWTITLTMDLT